MDLVTAGLILAWIAIMLLAFSLSGILRRVNELTGDLGAPNQIAGLATGSSLAPFLERKGWEGASALLFSDSECASCQRVVPLFAELAERNGPESRHVIVNRQASKPGRLDFDLPRHVEFALDAEAFRELDIRVVPLAVLLDDHGVVSAVEAVGSESRMREFAAHHALGGTR